MYPTHSIVKHFDQNNVEFQNVGGISFLITTAVGKM